MFDNATKLSILANFITTLPIYIFISISMCNTYKMKGWHLNYRTIFFTILIAITIHSFFTTFNDIFLLTNTSHITKNQNDAYGAIYDMVNLVSLYSPGILRLGIWLFVIERLIATKLRRTYEKKKSTILAFAIFATPFTYAIILYFCMQKWANFQFFYFSLCILIDFIILFLNFTLLYLNVKLKKLTLQNNKELSEKFQTNENIRLIKLMLPLVFSFIFINIIFNSLIDYGNLQFISKDDLLALNDTLLFIAYNIFLVYILFKFKKINDSKIGCLNGKNKKNELTDTANNIQSNSKTNTIAGNITLFSVDGKKIPTNYDQKSYFEMFAKSWNT